MRYTVVPVKNITKLAQAGDALIHRGPGEDGMGLIYGDAGAGKTTACAWFRNRTDGIYVRAMALWTPVAMLEAIATELGLPGSHRAAQMMTTIIDALRKRPRPIMIDEADYVIDYGKRMVETLRDLHDFSKSPVILIGMTGIERAVLSRKQLSDRILRDVHFKPCDLEDARMMAAALCEVEVEEDLLAELHKRSKGSPRQMVVGLSRIEDKAKAQGRDRINLAQWGGAKLFLADAQGAA